MLLPCCWKRFSPPSEPAPNIFGLISKETSGQISANYLEIRNLIRYVFHDEFDLFQLIFSNISQYTAFRRSGGRLFAGDLSFAPWSRPASGHCFEEPGPISAPIDASVFLEESALHPPLFRLQFAESVFGEGFALTPFLLGHFVDGRPALFHSPAFAHKDTLVLLKSGARALVLRLAAFDSPSFKFASRRRVLDRHSVSIVAFSSYDQ